ncbi:MAG: DUF354 domain-containing protein [Pyrinomonadaceae bacterium]
MKSSDHGIWIDLDNSPHVPLFLPIIRHYRESGVGVLLTARDHAQTIELLNLAGMDGEFIVIGKHYGKGVANKVRGLLMRSLQLAKHMRRQGRPQVAVSHGSRSMVLAAWLLRIPVITMYDYEHTETSIFNRLSDRVLVPDGIGDDVLDRIGLPASKCHKYAGLKEELYLRDFLPDPDFTTKLSTAIGREIPTDNVIIVLRPPASTANYHDARSDSIFATLITHLVEANDVFTIIVPRTRDQADEIEGRLASIEHADGNLAILRTAVSGLDLITAADVIISGGGTMNREAVLLGVPVYSIFQGEQGSLDRKMERTGEITFIRTETDLVKIRLEKRPEGGAKAELTDRVEQFVRKQIDFFVASRPQA